MSTKTTGGSAPTNEGRKARRFVNLTQHKAGPDQVLDDEPCEDLPEIAGLLGEEALAVPAEPAAELRRLLTFEGLPSPEEVEARAEALARMAAGLNAHAAMIGGYPALMAPLEAALLRRGIRVCYAHSERCSTEVVQPDGSVRKVSVFRHVGFVERLALLAGCTEVQR